MKNKKGFTLVELVVVIAIVGILAAIIIPSVIIYISRARQATANEDAKNLFDHLASYAEELDTIDDRSTLPDGIYYYGQNVQQNANFNQALSDAIEQEVGDISDNMCVLVKFVNSGFPKVIVATGGLNDEYYGIYPGSLKGEQEAYKTGAYKLM